MTKQKIYLLVGLILTISLLCGCLEQDTQTECSPNYTLDDEHELSDTKDEDTETIQQFNVKKECQDGSAVTELWVQEPEDPPASDPTYEKVLYCEGDNEFLVIKALGIAGSDFYLYQGQPCED